MSLLPVKILEYEDGKVIPSLNAALVAELKALMDKYSDPEPYLAYVYLMTAIDSPFANLSDDEKSESIIYEINQTIGAFDPFEPLLEEAVIKVNSLLDSPIVLLARELEQELGRFRKILRDTPMTMGGDDSNFRDRMMLMERIDKISDSYTKIKKKAEEELQVKLRGDSEMGEY
jgi:hypothetical protein